MSPRAFSRSLHRPQENLIRTTSDPGVTKQSEKIKNIEENIAKKDLEIAHLRHKITEQENMLKKRRIDVIDLIPKILLARIKSKLAAYLWNSVLTPTRSLLASNKLALLHLLIFTILICCLYQDTNNSKGT